MRWFNYNFEDIKKIFLAGREMKIPLQFSQNSKYFSQVFLIDNVKIGTGLPQKYTLWD